MRSSRLPDCSGFLTGKKLEVPIKRVLQGAGAERRAVALGSINRSELLAFFERLATSRDQDDSRPSGHRPGRRAYRSRRA